MKGKKWLLILVPVILIAVVAGLFWDSIVMYLAPKTVLSGAISQAFSALDQRTADSPLRLLAKGYDQEGLNTTQLALTVSDTAVGEIAYDMTVRSDLRNNQILAEGTVENGGNSLDVTAYLGREYLALTSEELLSGGWYGVTYDTFGDDIRSFALLDLLVPDATIAGWEESLASLKAFMNRSYAVPSLPEVSQEDMRLALLAVLALKSDVSRETISLNGLRLECWRIRYDITGDQAAEILTSLLPEAGPDSCISADFYLYEKMLLKARLQGTAREDSVEFVLNLGLNAAVDDLSLLAEKTEAGEETSLSLALSTRQQDGRYAETIRIGDTEISYDWDPSTGDMNLTLPDRAPIALTLTAAENGFTVQTKDFAALLNIQSQKDYDCTMTVAKGAAITAPEYKNLDRWSFEDLLVLLGGVGSLLGLKLK